MTTDMKTRIRATMDLGHHRPQIWTTTNYDQRQKDADVGHHRRKLGAKIWTTTDHSREDDSGPPWTQTRVTTDHG